jgi:hypothetical protein
MSDFPESLREARALDAQQHYADQARIAQLQARLAVIHEITLDTTAESSAEDIERIRLLASQ